jgi:hypothetical protein
VATLIAQGAAAGAVVARQSSPQSHALARGRGASSSDAADASDDISSSDSSDSECDAAPVARGGASPAQGATVGLELAKVELEKVELEAKVELELAELELAALELTRAREHAGRGEERHQYGAPAITFAISI